MALQGLRPVAAGLTTGLVGFAFASTVIDRFMFAVPANNVVSLILLAGAIGVMALLAMLLPVRRALRLDPARALRID